MRVRNPKTTALFFSKGKIVICGSKSEKMARFAARLYTRILIKMGYNAVWNPSSFKLANVVASVDLRFPIKLETLSFEHEDFCSVIFLFF